MSARITTIAPICLLALAGCSDSNYHATNPQTTPCSVGGIKADMPTGWTCATDTVENMSGVSFKPKDAQNPGLLFVSDPKKEDPATISDQDHWKSLVDNAPGVMKLGRFGGTIPGRLPNVTSYTAPTMSTTPNMGREIGYLVGKTNVCQMVEYESAAPQFAGSDRDDMNKILRTINIDP
jgi:hypothetical protein